MSESEAEGSDSAPSIDDPNPDKYVKLQCYNADHEKHILEDWYQMVKDPLDEETALHELSKESLRTTGKKGSTMNRYLKRAKKQSVDVSGITRTEAIAVQMYTDDDSSVAFFKEYNQACSVRNFEPYKVYSTLLMSALKKLALKKPLPEGTVLYRGLSVKLEPLALKRLFFKTFVSATMDVEVARSFAGLNGTILTLKLGAASQVASVGELTGFDEDEVIFTPFQEFEVMRYSDTEVILQMSSTQEFLSDTQIKYTPHVSVVSNLTERTYDTILLIRDFLKQSPDFLRSVKDSISSAIELPVDHPPVDVPYPEVASGKITVIPLGALASDISDVERFTKAAIKGFERTAESGFSTALLIGLEHGLHPFASEVTLLGTLHALFAPPNINNRAKITDVGIWLESDIPGNRNILSALENTRPSDPDSTEPEVENRAAAEEAGMPFKFIVFLQPVMQTSQHVDAVLQKLHCSVSYPHKVTDRIDKQRGFCLKAEPREKSHERCCYDRICKCHQRYVVAEQHKEVFSFDS